MLTTGRVVGIYVCKKAGLPMKKVRKTWAMRGQGLAGDRYAYAKGAYSDSKREIHRHVSLISQEAIDEAAKRTEGPPFTAIDTRRNIVTEGVDLNSLVGKVFFVGLAFMRGVELCDPCERPSKLSGKPGFKELFANCGGLRAEVIDNGTIVVGSEIHVTE